LQRFNVTYKIFTDSETNAKNIAKSISHENTVEIPSQIVPDGFIKDEIVGKIEKIYREKEFFLITISYLNKIVGSEINQLFNVIHGNTSMYQNVRVSDVKLNTNLKNIFGYKIENYELEKTKNPDEIFFTYNNGNEFCYRTNPFTRTP